VTGGVDDQKAGQFHLCFLKLKQDKNMFMVVLNYYYSITYQLSLWSTNHLPNRTFFRPLLQQ
jgi:hypothetical protein